MQLDTLKIKKDEFDIILIDSTDPMGPGEDLLQIDFTLMLNSLKKHYYGLSIKSPFAKLNQ